MWSGYFYGTADPEDREIEKRKLELNQRFKILASSGAFFWMVIE